MTKYLLSLPFAHKAAFISTCLSLIACSILTIANHQSQQSLARHSAEYFSQSLAHQVAIEASAPLIQGDKLSLQTLLDHLVDDSMVSHAAIYGVDSRPVVEAGSPKSDLLAQSASISSQDTLAGYVVISLDPYAITSQVKRNTWSLFSLTLLLSATVYITTLIIARPLAQLLAQLRDNLQDSQQPAEALYDSDDELCQLHNAVLSSSNGKQQPSGNECTLLHIEVDDVETLNESDEKIQTLLRQLETLCQLYQGQCEATRSNAFIINFAASNQETNNHPFRALCCAYLLQQLHRNDDELTLATSLTIHQHTTQSLGSTLLRQQQINELSELGHVQLSEVIGSKSVYQHSSVEGRVEANSSGILTTFNECYQSLLSNQLDMLRKQS
jgi:uncharacterized membrane protein affecting hemolysin expression